MNSLRADGVIVRVSQTPFARWIRCRVEHALQLRCFLAMEAEFNEPILLSDHFGGETRTLERNASSVR